MRISDWSSDVCSSDLYSPIVGAPSTGFSRRPEFYGIQFAQLLTGATFVPATLTGASRFVTAYAVERQGVRKVAIVNKDLTPATIKIGRASCRESVYQYV